MTTLTAPVTYRIPFNRPTRTPNDERYIAEALASGILRGNGQFTRRCQSQMERLLGVPRALLTTSCTDALEMAALLVDIREGDEVIVPAFTFVSSVNAFVLRGAKPVFCDVRRDTLSMDHEALDRLITPRTKCIVVVHYAGVGVDMDAVCAKARAVGAAVVEDNAHGFLGKFRGRWLGTFGDLATLSFHDSKNFTCGEGGALLVNNPKLVERAEIVREKGTDRTKFLRGEINKYGWVDLGSSFLPSDILAAMLASQLEDFEAVQGRRGALWHRYRSELAGWAARNEVALPSLCDDRTSSYHMFNLLVPSIPFRDEMFQFLKVRGIQAVSHYIPLHISPMGRQFGGHEGLCPVAEHVNEFIVRLPFFTNMTDEEQSEVSAAVEQFGRR